MEHFGGNMDGHGGGRRGGNTSQPTVPITAATTRRVLRYFLPYKSKATVILLCILASAVIGLVPPLLIRAIIDSAIPGGNLSFLSRLAIGMVLASLVAGFIGVAQNYLSNLIGQGVMYDMRNHLYGHLQSLHLGFFISVRTGETISRLNSDVAGIQNVVTGTLVSIVSNVAILATTLVMIFWMSWPLAIVSVLILPLFIVPTRRVGRIRQDLTRSIQEQRADLTHILQETLSVGGYILMKIFGQEQEEREKFRKKNWEVMRLQIRQALVGRWYFMIIGLFGTLGPALIYWLGGWLVLRDSMSLGTVVAFVAYLSRLYGPTSSLASVHVDVTASLALFDRIFQYLDMDTEIVDAPNAGVLPCVKGRVEFQDVTFHYREGRPVLEDISFIVEPGQTVALVGPSGAGKTTITYLVPRFYDPTSGRILLDGQDIRYVTLPSLREQIGMVTQDTFVYHDSVRHNLLYARPDADDEELERACRDAQLYETIMKMPWGFDTVVGERGYRLSGGERQRLAIARVILENSRLIVLDEATSSLDSVSERLIQSALEPLLRERTALVIAHRLSTILKADQILVIDGGRIVERGRHSELLERGSLYTRLYEAQFRDQELSTPSDDKILPASSEV
ncbi:MAG: ABC transporter ATP-binding protein [Chloroflexi bacterium]|nr:ABC transporter ATP-binding protein [Chloroflexota bacterium]